ncbi:MAG TPA: hypothetical protein VFE62_19610, partial [Gemmataceae bacterium]|nr:hypothetical protein [Gemmataceae bacterium]
MAKKIYPGAEFEPCDNEALPFHFGLFAQIGLLAPLPAKTKENLEKCPGALRLRRFRRDDVICRQGEEDCTAFYILKSADLIALRDYPRRRTQQLEADLAASATTRAELQANLARARNEGKAKEIEKLERQIRELAEKQLDWQREIASLPALAEKVRSLPAGPSPAPEAAFVRLGGPVAAPPAESWLQRLTRRFRGAAGSGGYRPTLSIPFDGPADINLNVRQAFLNEGELFGEMACLNRTPRSASVIAARECYMLEMLSNILTEIDKDPGYQAERNRVYKERALDLQLRDLSIFRDLSDHEFAVVAGEIRGSLELVGCKAGELICDEHDRSDFVYLVRTGLVQVKKNVSSLLSPDHITNWPGLLAVLQKDARLRRFLPVGQAFQPDNTSRQPGKADLPLAEQAEIVHGLNAVIKNRHFAATAEFQEIITRARLHERIRAAMRHKHRAVDRKDLEEVVTSATMREAKEQPTVNVEEWSELDQRRLNRLLLEQLLPGCLRPLPLTSGPDVILTYCSRGDFIGEMGVCRRLPRSSTCIAFGQPRSPLLGPRDPDLIQVELVRIPGEVFLRLIERFPAIRARVEAEMPRRTRRDELSLQAHPTGGSTQPLAKQSERLGLIEGQRLMLIDMERCTMCGECVRGCVDSHADGRSRLFLTGPRFDQYMVPM